MIRNIGVLTSGGDAPGMNACIRAVVRSGINAGFNVFGIKYGYQGMILGEIEQMDSYSVSNILQKGGTILKTARCEEFRTKSGRKIAYANLKSKDIDGLVVVGGNGSFTGAIVFYEEFGIPTVGIPSTIDNDLYGTDSTIGFDTAVNTALLSIDRIRDTANSHDRVFFIEVMGRNSGYIAVHCAIGGGAELVIIPETTTTLENVIETLQEGRDKDKTSAIVIVAEGGILGSAHDIAEKVTDKLPNLDIRVSTLGHLQRGGAPTSQDRLLGSRLGRASVEALSSGESNIMVGVENDTITFTKLDEAVSEIKPITSRLMSLIDEMNT